VESNMKKGLWDRGTCAVGCLILAAILACYLVTAVPVIKSDPPPHTLDWLGFSGSIIGAIMTLAAAGVAWFAVLRQICEARSDAEQKRGQEEFAARAMLPFALSAITEYADPCIDQLNGLPDPVLPDPTFLAPNIPEDHLESMRECLRYVQGEAAKQIFQMLTLLQIQNARYRDFGRRIRDGNSVPLRIELERRMIDALDLYALISRTFKYARGEGYQTIFPPGPELRTAFDLHVLHDVEYPLILTEIQNRS
jgi:hypothetical protein